MAVRIAAVVLVFAMAAACGGEGADQTVATPTPDAGGGEQAQAPKGVAAAFVKPKNNTKVSSPVALKMTASKIKIEEAGVVRKGAGHFHVMVDTKCVATGKVIPEDAKHVHYGDASTSAKLELKPGKHTLCLQVGNGAHKALGKTDTVKVTVK